MVRVEIYDPEEVSHVYYRMSQVPRLGDTVWIMSDEDNAYSIEGVVIQVTWLLVREKHNQDNSDCVVVKLGPLPGKGG